MRRLITLISFFLYFFAPALAQPPVPCTNGTQNTCTCSNSPVLCSIEELDGYTYEMTTYLHPGDGPDPMCPPPDGNGTTSHNPTWFRFPAWCEDLELEVCYTNCVDGPGCFGCCQYGIQAAVYYDCSLDPNSAVGCDTNVGECINNGCRLVELMGLEIGHIYSFLVDGCCGSACDIEINVIGACGVPEISEFTEIVGPTYICAGGDPVNYSVERPDGANWIHWYLDGVLLKEGVANSTNKNWLTTWTTPGTYELCVDASNNPCIPVTNDPEPFCIEVVVYDITPEDPPPGIVCPGDTWPYNGNNYGPGSYNFNFPNPDGCDSMVTLVVTVDPVEVVDLGVFELCDGETIDIGGNSYDMPGMFDITISQEQEPYCDSVLTFEIVFFTPDAGTLDVDPSPLCPDDTSSINVTNFNNDPDYEQYIVIVDDAGMVVEVITGASGEFSHDECAEFTVYSLNFHPLGGNVAPTIGSDFTTYDCTSGCCDIVEEPLIFEDDEAPTFPNPPADSTLSCVWLLNPMLPLAYEDNCIDPGTVVGVETGTANLCDGGTITRTWTITDLCDNTTTHTQTLTVEALALFEFIDPPGDETIICDSIPTSHPNLQYTNNSDGPCLIEGFVVPVVTGSADLCGGEITRTWTYTDTCMRTIEHVQIITVEPTDLPEWVNPPDNITVSCDSVPAGPVDLVISNGLSGDCGINDTIVGQTFGTYDLCGGELIYTWDYTDPCGTPFNYQQVVTINEVIEADWVDAPPDVTVSCDSIPTSHPSLDYTNGYMAGCEISGTAPPTTTGSANTLWR